MDASMTFEENAIMNSLFMMEQFDGSFRSKEILT
jgi:hypothetical protein